MKPDKEANPKSEKVSAVTFDVDIEELEQITAPAISFTFAHMSLVSQLGNPQLYLLMGSSDSNFEAVMSHPTSSISL